MARFVGRKHASIEMFQIMKGEHEKLADARAEWHGLMLRGGSIAYTGIRVEL